MNRFRAVPRVKFALAALTVLVAAAVASGAANGPSAPSVTLVVDRSFEIKTADPQRAFEPTAAIVDRGIYDTFFTYKGGDLAHPRPLLVQSWSASKDAKSFVFRLRRDVHFADGTPLTSAAGADKNDKAEKWLNSAGSRGAGSGPYLLQRYSITSQITLVPNPRYWGKRKAAFKTVVVRNMIAPTQLINIQRGKHEVAIDLSADQAQTIRGNKRLNVRTQPSTWTFWLFANNNPDISSLTSNKHFQAAVRFALDYRSIVSVAGPGAIQAPGIIPSMFLGSLPRKEATKQNLAKARTE